MTNEERYLYVYDNSPALKMSDIKTYSLHNKVLTIDGVSYPDLPDTRRISIHNLLDNYSYEQNR